MNRSLAIGLLVGLAAGSIAGALVAKSKATVPAPVIAAPAPASPVVPAPAPPKDDSRDGEIALLRAQVADLTTKLAAKSAKDETQPEEPGEADFAALGSRFSTLAAKGLKAFADPDFAKLLEELKSKKKAGLEYLADKLLNSKSQDDRFMAAAMMEGLHDPAAIAALSESLGKDDAGLVRRMSSHALAMIGTEASLAALRAAMGSDKDWGVRVNAAYGVAKQGQPDGAKMLEDAYFSKEAAGYQAVIFGALADVASPSSAPFFRRILSESSELGYLLQSIGALEKLKDVESTSLLNRIAADGKYDSTVREAAKKAAEALAK